MVLRRTALGTCWAQGSALTNAPKFPKNRRLKLSKSKHCGVKLVLGKPRYETLLKIGPVTSSGDVPVRAPTKNRGAFN